MNNNNILLRHNLIVMPSFDESCDDDVIATVLMNLSYYGYALSMDAYRSLIKLDKNQITIWWNDIETELKSITGDNRKISDFVVYKNFPSEVLSKSESEYWLPQILMYWGFPKEFFTEEVKPRDKMNEAVKAIVLKKSNKDSLSNIFNSYLKSPARWKKHEFEDVKYLAKQVPVNLAKLVFKENLVSLATYMMQEGCKINMAAATDVLRLAVGLSDGDISLRDKSKFKSFKKPERRFLLSNLEDCTNLTEDVARRPELFKRLLHQLHPWDYKKMFPRVCEVTDSLYNGKLVTFNSKVETLLNNKDEKVLEVLSDRPGDFRRRLSHTVKLFGDKAVKAFVADAVLDKLTTSQIVFTRSYLETVNDRLHRVFPPKGNWNKMQIKDINSMEDKHVKVISKALGNVLATRLPKVKVLDEASRFIKLPSNGSEVSPYNRGTVFPIPDDVKFIRTASYWQNTYHCWFDNGWNFFDGNWKSLGSCCWDEPKFGADAAVFSGDPMNSHEMNGRAAQLIDLYPDNLRDNGVRYAVWSILCFSRIPFAKATDVFAALQWGKDAQSGKLFEPSRCQLAFPLTGESLTKYIAMIDLQKREMVYIDANLHGIVNSAHQNCSSLEKNMPPFMEYIKSLPSVHDLFRESVDANSDGAHILYSDKDTELKSGSAYVFKQENKSNKYKAVDINNLLT